MPELENPPLLEQAMVAGNDPTVHRLPVAHSTSLGAANDEIVTLPPTLEEADPNVRTLLRAGENVTGVRYANRLWGQP